MAWSQEQIKNAAIIYRVGQSMGLGTRDIQIALITAMVESNLTNVNYGDRDSLGLFQQRPSQGWGTPEQVMDPVYAARKFYTTLRDLGSSRFTMGMGEAAQAVQRSAYPSRYAERIPDMRMLWPSVARGAGDAPLTLEGTPYLPDQLDGFMPEMPTVEQMVGSAVPEADPGVPNTNVMLGAWDMDAPQIAEEIDPLESGLGSFLSQGTQDLMNQTYAPFGKGVDGWRRAVVEAAKTALGTPYVWGGNSLQNGVDCSGLLQQAFAQAGLEIPRVSFQQANYGERVALNALQPGDLVAWDNSSRNSGADHIALYIGNGQIIEAARPGTAVRIRKLGSDEGAWGVQMNF